MKGNKGYMWSVGLTQALHVSLQISYYGLFRYGHKIKKLRIGNKKGWPNGG